MKDLINNIALLLALGVLYDTVALDPRLRRWWRSLALGLVLALMTIAVMSWPWELQPGVNFDGRSILLSLAALFFGTVPALIAAAAGALFRIYQGGPGAPMGVLVITCSALIGLGWARLRPARVQPFSWVDLFLFGIVVHLVLLACAVALPPALAPKVLAQIWKPVLLVYPFGTMFLGKLLANQARRRASDDAIQRNERRFRKMVERGLDLICVVDARGIIQYASSSMSRQLGRAESVFPGSRFEDWILAEDRALFAGILRDICGKPDSIQSIELRLSRHNAPPLLMRVTLTNRLADPDVEALVINSQDITERKQAEQSLLESEARYRSLFEDNHAPILLIDPAEAIVVDPNPAACAFYGYPREQFKGMRLDRINTLPLDSIKEEAAMSASAGRSHLRFQHHVADGTLREVETFSGPIHLGGRQLIYAIVHDITERVQAERDRDRIEAELRQAQKMEAIGRLAGGVAHDFNNMLGVILGYTEMILSSIPNEFPYRSDLLEVRSAAQRSADLTRQLLAFSRKQVTRPRRVDLNASIEEHRTMLARLMGEEITIHFEPGAGLWPITIDPSQLDQVLTNLLLNARDAMRGPGRITLRTATQTLEAPRRLSHDQAAPGDYILLVIHDQGEGMPPETLERIFEPFFTTKADGKGTGLGLATVYGIVRQNSGYIDVQSRPGRGTTFRVFFPRRDPEDETAPHGTAEPEPAAAPAATVAPAHEPIQPRHARGQTILLVEDEPTLLALAETILTSAGFHVLAVGDPERALDLAREHPDQIDMLLTDVVMPGMNGRDLDLALREILPGLRTLFMSGYTADVVLNRGVNGDLVNFIEKPFASADLIKKVGSILANAP